MKISRLEADVAKGRAKILKTKVLYTGKVFRLLRDTVIEPGGVRDGTDGAGATAGGGAAAAFG